MTPETAERIAAGLEAVAALLRESTKEQPKAQRLKLSAAAIQTGIPAKTLRELILRRDIPGVRVGSGRGIFMVDPREVEAYFQRKTSKARAATFPREVAL